LQLLARIKEQGVFVMAWTVGDYCTLDDIKADQSIVDQTTGIPTPSTSDDALIEDLITRCSRDIDDECGRHFYGIVETRLFNALDNVDGRDLLLDEDLAAVGDITLGTGDVLATTEYVLLPLNTVPKHQIRIKASSAHAWSSYFVDPEAAISVEGTWGYVPGTAPPQRIRQACIDLVRWRYRRRHAPFEQAGMGDLGQYQVPSGMPSDIQRMLGYYKRYVFGAIEGRD
jgi:hypothetical protein